MTDDVDHGKLFRARLLVLLASVLWSLSGLFIKSPPFQSIPADDRGLILACYRALFAGLFLLPLVRVRYIRWRPALIPLLIAFAAMNVLFVTAMTRTSAAAAIFLQNTSVVWAMLFGYFLLQERIERGSILAILIVLSGIFCIVAGDWAGENFDGNLIALTSGVCYALVVTFFRVLRDEHPAWLVALCLLTSAAIVAPWVWKLGITLTGQQFFLLALLGAVQLGTPYVVFSHAVKTVNSQEASLLVLTEPILNPIWVWLFWGETVSVSTFVGCALIIAGLFVRFLLFRPRRDLQLKNQ
ncbi:EamA-like transporter family protein [Gimesia panareensis]|uniref:EamA-like transporter family protein n=1 Tax=Gimesia panareensis TaxID=2527978 RepID=A0A517Q2I4_9PLAN|nr:DMT family transporter [Gimesia panareensis]QDT25792.1 EamA-like transporter family protein [Gimesia panareensis]